MDLELHYRNLKYGQEKFIYDDEYEISADDDTSEIDEAQNSSSESLKVFKPTKIRYDLAPEYHRDAFRKYDIIKQKHSEFRARLDGDFSKTKIISRFSKLHPKIIKEYHSGRPSFDFLRNVSVQKLKYETFKMLNIIYEFQACAEDYTTLDIPENVFSWADEDFINRRQMENVVWADVLMREINHDCLNKLKFKFDVEELRKYLQKMFDSLLGENQEMHSTTVSNIQLVYKNMNKINDLSKEFDVNKKTFFDVVNASLGLKIFKLDDETLRYQKVLQDQLMNLDVYDPIELRYHLSYIKSKVNYNETKTIEPVNKLLNKLKQYDDMLKTEQYCSQCTLNAIYTDSQDYKNKIEEMTNVFDIELEKIDNKIIANNLKIEKLQHHRQFLTEEIERFYEEYELLRQREIKEELRQERLKQERLEKIAARKAAAAKKRAAKKAAELAKKRAILNR